PIILFGFTIYMVVDHFCHKWINILSGVGHKDGRGGANLCPSSDSTIQQHQACIDACNKCMQACEECVYHHV
ncbi:four-helix bundle copper-binding protein, partial [Halalkalibacter oceani]|uniref:four-helix bundle copper-binding protein n=1 Tax=Halalkalibacter oceani TaxID=1653776 RepID=UPI003D9C82E3